MTVLAGAPVRGDEHVQAAAVHELQPAKVDHDAIGARRLGVAECSLKQVRGREVELATKREDEPSGEILGPDQKLIGAYALVHDASPSAVLPAVMARRPTQHGQ